MEGKNSAREGGGTAADLLLPVALKRIEGCISMTSCVVSGTARIPRVPVWCERARRRIGVCVGSKESMSSSKMNSVLENPFCCFFSCLIIVFCGRIADWPFERHR
ncbi:hypothetical protein BDV98DRAFT_575640 [Pterulicium gracile]|uniref:Uncharacterized protein n=1 Tax=Pterulicium gracile TaxID=1884261 RepID=A0A5C3QEI7_9AGAR|nr:hypothetical protein BDV98DRAFT_575640 [Pterula gracilis]